MRTITRGLALAAIVALMTGCIVIPIERHVTETHHHYYGEVEQVDVVDTPAPCTVVEED